LLNGVRLLADEVAMANWIEPGGDASLHVPAASGHAPFWSRGPLGRWARSLVGWLPRGRSLNEDVWRVRHRTLSYLLRAHVLGVLCFGLIIGRTLGESFEAASIVAVFACLASTDIRRRKFVSGMTAVGLVTASAVLVSLSGGVIEMHFHFFVMVGILTLYQDWLPFLLAIGFVVLHHGILGTLDPSAVYDHPDAVAHPFKWALIHGGFVLAASVASVVAWRLNEEQAFRDALTRLQNRALFQDRVGHALARSGRRPGALAVLFVDLDGFKGVNDTLGHGAGDELLREVAERLRACVRPADTVARLGGDEFAILLEDVSAQDDATAIARRVIDAIAAPFVISGRDTGVTASVGVAFNTNATTTDELLRNADVAMYSVKESGRASYKLFETEMHSAVVSRVELEHQIRVACDRQEFTIYYQPIVSLETGRLSGVEALIRWQHPTRGLLSPADFIDVAARTGAIVPIGSWVLDTACQHARQWRRRYEDVPFTISVNLSPVQLFQENVVATVRGALGRWDLPADALVLELTEEVMIRDSDTAIARLHELKDVGVRLAIDDFGTGYSSLNYLRHLPVDILKIDKGFIDGLTVGATESAFGKLIIDFAHTLGLRTVAEGVEHAEQVAVLQRLGCHFAQGYLFSRPLPATEVAAALDAARHEPTWSGHTVGPIA
jgi:diguanylate cyclase (GGDEF)-like protein